MRRARLARRAAPALRGAFCWRAAHRLDLRRRKNGTVSAERVLLAIDRLPLDAAAEPDYDLLSEAKMLLLQNVGSGVDRHFVLKERLQRKLVHCCRLFAGLGRPDLVLRAFVLLEPSPFPLSPADLAFFGGYFHQAFEKRDRNPFMTKVKEVVLARLIPQVCLAVEEGQPDEVLLAWMGFAERVRLLDEDLLRFAFEHLRAKARSNAFLPVGQAARLVSLCSWHEGYCQSAGECLLGSVESQASVCAQDAFDALCAYCLWRVSQSFHRRTLEQKSRFFGAFVWRFDEIGRNVPESVLGLLRTVAAASTRFRAKAEMIGALSFVLAEQGQTRAFLTEKVEEIPEEKQNLREVLSRSEMRQTVAEAGALLAADDLHAASQHGESRRGDRLLLVAESFDLNCLGGFKSAYLLKLFGRVSSSLLRVLCVEKEFLSFALINGNLPDLLAELSKQTRGNLVTINCEFFEDPPHVAWPHSTEEGPQTQESRRREDRSTS